MSRAVAALVALALLAGCGYERSAITSGGRVLGDNLTVYSTLPEPQHGVGLDMVDAQKLALLQRGGRAGDFGINFVSIGEGPLDRDAPRRVTAAAAEQAVRDTQTVAVIGALRSNSARTELPLLNAAGFLLVSPGAGAVALDEPRFHPAGYDTFERVIGDDDAQAQRLLEIAEGRVAVEVEAGPEGEALAAALARDDRVVDDPQDADTVIYAGTDRRSAAGVAEALARETDATLVFPDELTRAGVAALLPRAVRRRSVFVSSAPEPGSTPELIEFERAFEQEYGRAPDPYAVLGYTAMNRVLDAITRAGSRANVRRAVVDAAGDLPGLSVGFTAYRLAGGRRDYL
jgi:hypothetical protein